jgi:hypothetical protein
MMLEAGESRELVAVLDHSMSSISDIQSAINSLIWLEKEADIPIVNDRRVFEVFGLFR